ncbi:unnamed protein product [Rhizoctonia solani]|uniref:Uncharacterized protein n=1 Tax=Rhizoctonia solani TaxID=456999 RepID=A0A8H3DTI3_9AGAM|nr:unnamed protein product [Rhizoctonia solani]
MVPPRERATPIQTRQQNFKTASVGPTKTRKVTAGKEGLENSFNLVEHNSEGRCQEPQVDFATITHDHDAFCATLHPSFRLTGSSTIKGRQQNDSEASKDRSSYSTDYAAAPQGAVLCTPVIEASGCTAPDRNSVPCQQLPFPLSLNHTHTTKLDTGPQDPEDTHVRRIIYGSLVLDRTLESNSLPFILESYAAWIQRTAFDPVKVARKTRDHIARHYGDSVESRWTTILIANLIRRLAKNRSMDGIRTPAYLAIVTALRKQVCLRIAHFKLGFDTGELVMEDALMILDNVVDTTMIFGVAGNMNPGMELMREAAPMFHQACPKSPDKRIHLQTLFLLPTESLRDYAALDIFSSVVTSRPMFFQYNTTIDSVLESSVWNFSDDAEIQWAHGLPNQIMLVFARINTLRSASIWDLELFNELETTLQEFVPISAMSGEPNLALGKIAVQECWRQAAYIYLYMGLYEADSSDLRVISALSGFLIVINNVKPGHIPDTFIMLCFAIVGVAARNQADRGVIRYRILGVEDFGCRGSCILAMLEWLWKKVDAENRPAVWIDLSMPC